MAALHAILERARVPGDGLFLLQRQPSRLRTPPRIDSPIPMDPEEEEEEAESEFERNTRGLLDEIFADAPPHLARAGPSISRRDAVQSLSDDDDALMNEPVYSRSVSNASIDSDFSMSLELKQNSDEEGEDGRDASPAAAAAALSRSSSQNTMVWHGAAHAAEAAQLSQVTRAHSIAWSELEEASRASSPLLNQDWGSLEPGPFVPPALPLPALPPLENEEQIEARERAALKVKMDRLEAIAAEHAAVARQQQLQLLSDQQSVRERIQGNPPDIANVAPAQGRMPVPLVNGLVAKYSSPDLGDPFNFMQPITYTKARKFRLTGRNPQRLIWSIKLDGNRALWDGWNQLLVSKSSRIKIKPPSFWRLLMPRDCYLDGELFVPSEKRVNGTKTEFAASLYEVAPVWRIHPDSISGQNSNIHDNDWLKFQFHAFDILGTKLNDKPLSERLSVLEATLRKFEHDHPTEKPVFRRVYTANLEGDTTAQVHKSIERLLEYYGKGLGAEGIVIKDLNSPYKHRSPWPSSDWLKAKYYEDVEAKVEVDRHVTAKGEKAVIIMLPDQRQTTQVVTFANGNLISANKLKKGMIVTIAFMPDRDRPDSEKLRTPIIRSIVEDGTTWQDVLTRQREKEQEAAAAER